MHLSVKSWPDKPIVAAAENSSESTGSLQQYIYIFKCLNQHLRYPKEAEGQRI